MLIRSLDYDTAAYPQLIRSSSAAYPQLGFGRGFGRGRKLFTASRKLYAPTRKL